MVEQPEPIHSDQHRSRWNITLIFALAVAVLGVVNGAGGWVLILLGLAMAAFSWLTTPRAYFIYRDALVIAYGTPRTKAIPFAEISHLELLALPIGERLRLRLLSGRREMLIPRDNAVFQQHLEQALSDYSAQQGGTFVEGTLTPGRGTPGDAANIAGAAGSGAAVADGAIDPATGAGGDATPAPFDAEPAYGASVDAAPVSRDAPILKFEDDAPSAAPPPPAESSSPPDDANTRPPSPY